MKWETGGEGGRVYIGGKGTSSLGNAYLSKQYANMSDNIKCFKSNSRGYQRFQVCEQNFQVQCENSRLSTEATEVESARGKAMLPARTFIPSALSVQLHQT